LTRASVAADDHPAPSCLVAGARAQATGDTLPLVYYNRVAKAGSSNMKYLLRNMSSSCNFVWTSSGRFFDDPKANVRTVGAFFAEATQQGRPAVYVNHMSYEDAGHSLMFRKLLGNKAAAVRYINIVRDPVARAASFYNYRIDVSLRGIKAKQESDARKRDHKCGCYKTSFSKCVARASGAGCPRNAVLFDRTGHGLMAYFLSRAAFAKYKSVKCSREKAAAWIDMAKVNMESYAVIGIVERMRDTMRLLEERLPAVFGGVLQAYDGQAATAVRATRSGSRALGNTTREFLQSNPCNAGEFSLWAHAKQLFSQAAGMDVADLA
jgi:hypothetical protein